MESEDGVCVLCEFVVEVAEDKLLTNRTFDMTKRAVQMICSYMPRSIAEKSLKTVPARVKGVRTPATMTAFMGSPAWD